jgi:hypothetical protein
MTGLRATTLFQQASAATLEMLFIFSFLFLVVDASQAPGSAKSVLKSAGACTAITIFSV